MISQVVFIFWGFFIFPCLLEIPGIVCSQKLLTIPAKFTPHPSSFLLIINFGILTPIQIQDSSLANSHFFRFPKRQITEIVPDIQDIYLGIIIKRQSDACMYRLASESLPPPSPFYFSQENCKHNPHYPIHNPFQSSFGLYSQHTTGLIQRKQSEPAKQPRKFARVAKQHGKISFPIGFPPICTNGIEQFKSKLSTFKHSLYFDPILDFKRISLFNLFFFRPVTNQRLNRLFQFPAEFSNRSILTEQGQQPAMGIRTRDREHSCTLAINKDVALKFINTFKKRHPRHCLAPIFSNDSPIGELFYQLKEAVTPMICYDPAPERKPKPRPL